MVPRRRLRTLLLAVLRQTVTESADGVDSLMAALRAAVQAASVDESQVLPAFERELKQVQQSLRNLAKVAEAGNRCPQTIVQRMAELEERQGDIERQIRELKARCNAPTALPDRAWVLDQLEQLNAWLQEDERDLAAVFRAVTGGRIEMIEVKPAGKKRGYFKAKFRGGALGVLNASCCAEPADDPRSAIVQEGFARVERADIIIDVVPPSRAEAIADEVYRLRQDGHQWKDIRRRLRCGHATVHEAYEIAVHRKAG